MLHTLYENIQTLLKQYLKGLKLPAASFGTAPPGQNRPYFQIAGETFVLKVPQLKRKEDVKQLDATEVFAISSGANSNAKPYALKNSPTEITSVLVLENKGTEQETTTKVESSQYTLDGNKLTLTNSKYTKGAEIIVSYKYRGIEYSDRFEERFTLKIFDEDLAKLEKYALLSLPAIWAGMGSLVNNTYSYSLGNLRTKVSVNELIFEGQETIYENPQMSMLRFRVNGVVTFVETKTDGNRTIEKISINDTGLLQNV